MSQVFSPELNSRQPLACRMLQAACQRQALAQAYLLTGRGLADKRQIAQQLACHLNCQNISAGSSCAARSLPSETACQNCRWIWQEAHPQAWIVISGAGDGAGVISVEKARNLSLELSKTSAYKRLVIISAADQDVFHRPAANALLKTIEEPGEDTVFFLFARHSQDVLPTIVSRCQEIPLSTPFEVGLCLPEPGYSNLTLSNAQAENERSRNYWASFAGVGKASASVLAALEWASELESIASDDSSWHLTIDSVVAHDYQRYRQEAVSNPRVSKYLRSLLHLAEEAKAQIDHFVKPKNALEAFCLSCYRLRQQQYPEVGRGER